MSGRDVTPDGRTGQYPVGSAGAEVERPQILLDVAVARAPREQHPPPSREWCGKEKTSAVRDHHRGLAPDGGNPSQLEPTELDVHDAPVVKPSESRIRGHRVRQGDSRPTDDGEFFELHT